MEGKKRIFEILVADGSGSLVGTNKFIQKKTAMFNKNLKAS